MGNAMALIMAAGEGKRMKSKHPKPLFKLCGKPILEYVMLAAQEACGTKPVLIVGKGHEEIRDAFGDEADYVMQEEQLGTGHAVMMAKDYLEKGSHYTLVLAGDMPFITSNTIKRILETAKKAAAVVLAATMEDPTGYGRAVIRDGCVQKIIEDKDCTDEQKRIKQVNSSVYCFNTEKLLQCLGKLKNNNAQGEYYLTDCIEMLATAGEKVAAVITDAEECVGINDRVQLSDAQRIMAQKINTAHMRDGVTLIAPENTYIDSDVKIGRDTTIYPDVVLEGCTEIGEDCILYPGSRIADSIIGNGVRVQNSVILESKVGDKSTIGPYAYLRPNSNISAGCRIGDFVEIKNSTVGEGSKVPHLSYIGDGSIGKGCNIGCGSIFVNYDGVNKHHTQVEDGVFIGCNTNLIAPVTVGREAYVAAGSTVTDDVPEGALCIARERQVIKEGWTEKIKAMRATKKANT